jgi:hypothetical protein
MNDTQNPSGLLDRLLPVEAAADVLQLSPRTLRRWVREGRVSAHELQLPESAAAESRFAKGILPVPYFKVREILDDITVRRVGA